MSIGGDLFCGSFVFSIHKFLMVYYFYEGLQFCLSTMCSSALLFNSIQNIKSPGHFLSDILNLFLILIHFPKGPILHHTPPTQNNQNVPSLHNLTYLIWLSLFLGQRRLRRRWIRRRRRHRRFVDCHLWIDGNWKTILEFLTKRKRNLNSVGSI